MRIKVRDVKGDLVVSSVWDSDPPEIDKVYVLEDYLTGTLAQNRMFHLLVEEYFRSGTYQDPAVTEKDLKNHIKKRIGCGAETYIYSDFMGHLHKVDTIDEIPKYARVDTARCFMHLKSWSEYTKAERTRTIDRLITEMEAAGVNSKRFDSIIAQAYEGGFRG